MLERGRVVHDVLAAFHRQVNERLGRPGSPLELDEAEFDALLAAAIQRIASARAAKSRPGRAPRGRSPAGRRVAVAISRAGREIRRPVEGLQRPDGAGVVRGLVRPQRRAVAVDRRAVGVRQRRADRSASPAGSTASTRATVAGQTVFNVVDYKTGGAIRLTPESIAAGTTLQLPLYAIAAMELLLADRDALPWRAGYWYVRDDGFKPKQALVMYEDDRRPDRTRTASGRTSATGWATSWPDWSSRSARANFPCAAPTTTAPAAAPSAPSAASIKFVPWRRHGNRRRANEHVPGSDRPAAPGGDRARRVGCAVGRRGLRQDVRADRAVSGGIGARRPARGRPRTPLAARPTCGHHVHRAGRPRNAQAAFARPAASGWWNVPSSRSTIGSRWFANWTRRGSARSTRSAARCCGRMPSRPASIRGSACSTRAQAGTLLFELTDDVLRNRLADRDEAALGAGDAIRPRPAPRDDRPAAGRAAGDRLGGVAKRNARGARRSAGKTSGGATRCRASCGGSASRPTPRRCSILAMRYPPDHPVMRERCDFLLEQLPKLRATRRRDACTARAACGDPRERQGARRRNEEELGKRRRLRAIQGRRQGAARRDRQGRAADAIRRGGRSARRRNAPCKRSPWPPTWPSNTTEKKRELGVLDFNDLLIHARRLAGRRRARRIAQAAGRPNPPAAGR